MPDTSRSAPSVGRKTRLSTFKPKKSDLYTKYAHITSRAERAIAFIEGECLIPEGRGQGTPYRLFDFQKELLRKILDDPDCLVAFVSACRAFGKTGLFAPMLVFFLYDQESAQVIAASTAMRTARLSYDRAVRIVQLSPRLNEQALIFHNAANPYVQLPDRGAFLFPLPAEEKYVIGMSPSVVLLDEAGYLERPTYESLVTSLGKREGSICIAIGTPGVSTVDKSGENLMHSMRSVVYGENPPYGIRYYEYAADLRDDPGDPATWKKANPAYGLLVDPKVYYSEYAVATTSAGKMARFQQMRLGIWSQHENSWMPLTLWEALGVDDAPIPEGAAVSLGIDLSASGDGSGVVAYEHGSGRISVVGYWENPTGDKDWRIPRDEVMACIDMAFSKYTVSHANMDPWGWRSELEAFQKQYGDRMLEFNTAHDSRMAPAVDDFYAAVAKKELVWDGDTRLRSHVLSAVAKPRKEGHALDKDARKPQKIDLAVAAILAFEAARTYVPKVDWDIM